jgi:hypothetical protein
MSSASFHCDSSVNLIAACEAAHLKHRVGLSMSSTLETCRCSAAGAGSRQEQEKELLRGSRGITGSEGIPRKGQKAKLIGLVFDTVRPVFPVEILISLGSEGHRYAK